MDQNHFHEFVSKTCAQFNLKSPLLYIIVTAEPLPYSISTINSQIYLSIVLIYIFTIKYLYAVLLHEVGHIRDRDSLYRFGALFYRITSPFAAFVPLINHVDDEEKLADAFAISIQGTDNYVNEAKKKMQSYHSFDE